MRFARFTVRGFFATVVLASVPFASACSRAEATSTQPVASSSVKRAAPVPTAKPSAPPPPARPPSNTNVILISIDSLRADMPWAGYDRPIAPRLTELESRSVSYTRAHSISSYTSMSLGGFLGGKLPGEMRRDGFFFGTYGNNNVMFPELLQAAHVHTLAAMAHGYFREPSLKQGFDTWEMVLDMKWNATTDENVSSPQQERLAEKLLSAKACADGRFFAWFHFMDPHDEYLPHPDVTPWGPKLRDRYDGEVTFTDKYVGKLVDFIQAQPWGTHTAIIVTADHGEALGEHGQFKHGFEVWENLVHVPLFFLMPGAKPARISALRSNVDLAPTILDVFGVAPDPGFEGKSLLSEIYGGPVEEHDIVVDLPATSDSDRRRAIYHGAYKLIAFGSEKVDPTSLMKPLTFQMFDLDQDPSESSPITKGPAFEDMVARYKAVQAKTADQPAYACKEDCLAGAYRSKDGGS